MLYTSGETIENETSGNHNESRCGHSHTEAECPLPIPGTHSCERACAMCAYVARLESGSVGDDRPPQVTGARGLAGFKAEAQDALERGGVCDRWSSTFATEGGFVDVQEVEA